MLSTRLVSQLGDANSTLRATTQRSGSAVMIYAGGEVDAYNEDTWRRLLSESAAVVTPPGVLVVDVNCLDFMGSCAYAALVEEEDRCRRRGVHLCLVSRAPAVARIVAICGLSELLTIYPSVESALSVLTPGSPDW